MATIAHLAAAEMASTAVSMPSRPCDVRFSRLCQRSFQKSHFGLLHFAVSLSAPDPERTVQRPTPSVASLGTHETPRPAWQDARILAASCSNHAAAAGAWIETSSAALATEGAEAAADRELGAVPVMGEYVADAGDSSVYQNTAAAAQPCPTFGTIAESQVAWKTWKFRQRRAACSYAGLESVLARLDEPDARSRLMAPIWPDEWTCQQFVPTGKERGPAGWRSPSYRLRSAQESPSGCSEASL